MSFADRPGARITTYTDTMNSLPTKSLIPNWLDNPNLSHVQACFVRLQTGESSVQGAGPESSNEEFDLVMKHIASLVPLLVQQRLLPGSMVWNFVGGKLY